MLFISILYICRITKKNKMKKLNLIMLLLFSITISAQSVVEVTYLDIPATEIGDFVKAHKKITDMSQDENRTIQASWVYRHWYGSGASVVIYDLYNSAEDAINDDPFAALNKNVKKLSDEKQKEMEATFDVWWSGFNNHWDEMRNYNMDNYFVTKENVDWDIPFVYVEGNYNSSGSEADLADAFMEWSIKPGVKDGLMMAGGATLHYKGAGSDVQFFSTYKDITEFAKQISNSGSDNSEASSKFWSLVEGSHNDQILIHVGHLENGVFNLAGKDN